MRGRTPPRSNLSMNDDLLCKQRFSEGQIVVRVRQLIETLRCIGMNRDAGLGAGNSLARCMQCFVVSVQCISLMRVLGAWVYGLDIVFE